MTTDFHFTGHFQGVVTFAYDARTGRQLWASRYRPKDSGAAVSGLAVSPDGTTLYLAGTLGQAHSLFFGVIAYAAATGKQRWQRYSTGERGYADSVAVSPDGKTVYATGSAGSCALTVAYGAAGTLKWAARYKDPYGFAAGSQIVAGPGGAPSMSRARLRTRTGTSTSRRSRIARPPAGACGWTATTRASRQLLGRRRSP